MNFALPTALEYARAGRIEEWVHAYLTTGDWANPAFSAGLKLQPRWWRGPLEYPLSLLARCVGPEPGMEYLVTREYWERRIGALVDGIRASGATPLDLPPLIASYDPTCPPALRRSVRDGNHRMGAYERLGWPTAWVIIWYNSEKEFLHDAANPPILAANS